MTVAPDGRIFVCEEKGRLRVIKDGALLPKPFVTVKVYAHGERGLHHEARVPGDLVPRVADQEVTRDPPGDPEPHQEHEQQNQIELQAQPHVRPPRRGRLATGGQLAVGLGEPDQAEGD